MEKIIRYGIVGCGTHAYRGHYLPGKNIPGLQLVALCDPDSGAYPDAKSFTKDDAEGVVMHRDYREFLAHPDLDAVVIVSPDKFHTAQLDAAIEAGKHALVDKPAAANMADIIQLHVTLEKARSRGLVVSSCHPRRFNPAYAQVKAAMEDLVSAAGPAIEISLDFSYHVPQASRENLHTGMLADHMNHEFDFMNFLFGKADCEAMRILDEKDRYVAAGIRADKITFHFTGTRRLTGRNYPETIRIRFERGELTVYTKTQEVRIDSNGFALELREESSFITLYSHEDLQSTTGNETDSALEIVDSPSTNYEVALTAIMSDFATAIAEGKPPYLSHDDIYYNSLICVELTERKNCSIKFPR